MEKERAGLPVHYLITGGAGFIGTHLALRLLEMGNQVTILDNLSTGRADRLAGTAANLVIGCVTDRDLVHTLAADCDQIIHLACVVGVRLALTRGRETLRLSFLGTENILEAASVYDRDIFIASSSAVYGKVPRFPVAEEDDSLLGASIKDGWLYSVGKLVEEYLSIAYFREKGTKVKIGRFFNVIGPYQTGSYGMVVPTFISKALKGEPLPVYGNGLQTRTFCYIEDILDGLEIVLQKGTQGEVYNIGGCEETSILALAEKIIAMTSSPSIIEFIPFASVFGKAFEETSRRVPDISRLKRLGYKPRYTLDQALAAIISHHRREYARG